MQRMDYSDAERTLEAMLDQAGANHLTPDPAGTWAVFKEFAALPVEGVDAAHGDMFLFQWGAYDWQDGNGQRFEVDFLRQFSINAPSGEYDHMEQLHCTFFFELTDELREFGSGEEWIDDDLDTGFAALEALPVFAVLHDSPAPPVEMRVEQEQV